MGRDDGLELVEEKKTRLVGWLIGRGKILTLHETLLEPIVKLRKSLVPHQSQEVAANAASIQPCSAALEQHLKVTSCVPGLVPLG